MFATSRKTDKMVCKVGGSSDEENFVPAHLSDALLYIIMYMIGLQVDVHVKDGSVYTGILYTVSAKGNHVETVVLDLGGNRFLFIDYKILVNGEGIVLKKAMMTKKGNREVNIENESLVDTLVVEGEDIVQVVAKGVPISDTGIFGGETTSGKLNQSNVNKQHANGTRLAGDGLNVEQRDAKRKTEYQGPEIVNSVHFSSSDREHEVLPETKYKVKPVGVPSHAPASSRLHDQSFEKHASEKSPYFNDVLYVSSTDSASRLINHSTSSTSAKDSKLNPEANVFTPSPYRHVLMIPASPAEVPHIGYFVDPSLMPRADATQLEYNHAIQPVYDVTGYARDQIQAVTYAAPYQIEAASAYMHQNSQNILAGQMGIPVYLPPLAHDAVTASGLSQASLSPILAHYQVHLPKHQDHFNQPHQT